MKRLLYRSPLWIASLLLISLLGVANAGVKIYYIRHAQGGHNVVDEWKDKPKEQWPAYVGNQNMFTPKGEAQMVEATEKLKAYHFDLIAVSPIWRTRHTIFPYLKETGMKAEIWPELAEFSPLYTNLISRSALPQPSADLFSGGGVIKLPEQEKPYFTLLADDQNSFKTGKEPMQLAADLTAVAEKTVSLIHTRFGGSNKSILLVGHDNMGRLLLHVLLKNTKDSKAWKTELANTGIWMAEEQADGSFKLQLFNDSPYVETAP